LSPHLRWGTLSPRLAEEALLSQDGKGPAALRRQLAWRDFNAHLLLAHPNSLRTGLRGRELRCDDAPERLAAWQEGRTGYPLVDAGMRQLARQGWMHNRARMLTASFLVHDLHLHWRTGEEHFARLLYDGEPAQNSLNWQWVAGVGADPGEFLRVFNPTTQAREFDPDGTYIARWVPELARLPAALRLEPWAAPLDLESADFVPGRDYPAPIVDHAVERREALARFAGEVVP
ncbi:MAG: phrB, partial [Solirubrobacterales bacterium]|nr:phrB [Solirubrobacterales bacterium]